MILNMMLVLIARYNASVVLCWDIKRFFEPN